MRRNRVCNCMNLLIPIVTAAIPTAIYTMLIWWLDRYEKEPLWLIAVAFLWGSLPAIGLSLLFELGIVLPAGSLGPTVDAGGLAAIVEEPIKALALVGLFLFMHHEFDGLLDGIVYGSLIGFGFSMTENLLYFLRFESNLGALFWVRGIFFGLNHALFTSLVGLALGAVRYRHSRSLRTVAFCCGLALAILFHALHNYAVGYRFPGLVLSWLIQSSGVLVVLAIAALAWRNERQWIERELTDEVRAGVISPADYAELSSSGSRVQRQLRALLSGGWASYHRVRRRHHLATKLAFCKGQLGLADGLAGAGERARLQQAIGDLRSALREG